jgi:hypothetical protein
MATTIDRPSRPIGATVGLFFGGLWCVLGSQALPQHWQLPVIVAGWIVTLLLVLRLWRLPAFGAGGGAMFRQRTYLVAVALEVVALVAANNLLPKMGFGDELIPVVGIIVGLHFIGLWQATGLRRFLGIAVAMCVVSAFSALLPSLWGNIDPRVAVCGFGSALVLWIGAGLAL